MSVPNWASLTTLKSPLYLDLKDADTGRDTALILLGQEITAQMISYLDNPDIDSGAPAIALQRACLKQCTHEWKQRTTPGLSSVTMTDGSINKMQIDEWLKDVERILLRYRKYVLYETSTGA